MRGKSVAYCVNNVWTEAAPECVPIHNGSLHSRRRTEPHFYKERYFLNRTKDSESQNQRGLFNWGSNPDAYGTRQSVYGDGPRRLPLINGIWPSVDQVEQVMALGPQSTPGPKIMVKEEIDIAELRNKQLEELRKQRYKDGIFSSQKKTESSTIGNSVLIDPSIPRETVVSLVNTEDGDALSIALSKPNKDEFKTHRKHRHRMGRKRKLRKHPTYPSYIVSRESRVDTSGIAPPYAMYHFRHTRKNGVEELRRRPIESVLAPSEVAILGEFDTSCVESLHGREVPILAPQVNHAFVYRYETKKNKQYPFNRYMQVKYRCLNDFVFVNSKAEKLRCKEGRWVGEMPRCIQQRN
ncbi:uncharacterized protein LOC129231406 [Uloborus diversus]|uniref:uncharacterized protein LOC129231406 n=1 Tax=Uloborus diversus TaxID=327109 RepID=UPI002408F5F0|nr:uncharacterized protein LOC129231406 [Uloborus diversus]